jgi:hypothetical protein
MPYPGGDGLLVYLILGLQKRSWFQTQSSASEIPTSLLTMSLTRELPGFVRVRFALLCFEKKRGKSCFVFRNTQSSFWAFSFPLYFKKIKRPKENLELLNVHSYHPLERSGIQN